MTYNKVIVFIDKTCVQALWPVRHTFLSKVIVKLVVHRIKWRHAEIKIGIQEGTFYGHGSAHTGLGHWRRYRLWLCHVDCSPSIQRSTRSIMIIDTVNHRLSTLFGICG